MWGAGTHSMNSFSIMDGEIYTRGAIFRRRPNSDLAQNCASHAVSLSYMQNECMSIQRGYSL